MADDFKKFLDKNVLSPQRIATRYGVPVGSVRKQLAMGIEEEKEHTSSPEVAQRIALAHLGATPDYYTKLKKIEK